MAEQKTISMDSEREDKVFFMTAYNVNEYKRNFSFTFKKECMKELLSQYHISTVSAGDVVYMKDGKFKFKTTFSYYKQATNYEIEAADEQSKSADYDQVMEKISKTICLKHSEKLLFDSNCFELSFIFEMESFLIKIEKGTFQVNPWGFFLNGMVIIVYEVLNYDKGSGVKYNEIFGPTNNFNIMPVNEMRYFDEPEFSEGARNISEIIYGNIIGFLESVLKNKYKADNFSLVHNILVVSNSIEDKEKYFKDVLGAGEVELQIKNLNTTTAFEYYSQEYMGVVSAVSQDAWNQVQSDCVLLEAMKMYLFLQMIVGYEIKDKLEDTIDNQLYVERLFYPSGVPIITMNVLASIKETQSFKQYKEANNFKISYFKLMQERKKNQNNLFLNILLYLLALISGIGTLQVLQAEFGWPFKVSFVILILVFIGLGIFWIYKECDKGNR